MHLMTWTRVVSSQVRLRLGQKTRQVGAALTRDWVMDGSQ